MVHMKNQSLGSLEHGCYYLDIVSDGAQKHKGS